MPPEFEYDQLKSLANWFKHGITLASARRFWDSPHRRYAKAYTSQGEIRHALYCKYEKEIWVAFFTLRDGKVRLFSARRASRKERRRHQF